jgi:hypothetical protein
MKAMPATQTKIEISSFLYDIRGRLGLSEGMLLEVLMAKSHDAKKSDKKAPQKTAKEKKAAKDAKKAAKD